MAFDLDAKLPDVLAGGYHLSTQLQALLSHPLDRSGQEVAMAFSQELSRVFEVSMSMLNSNNAAALEVNTGNSTGVSTPAKDQRVRSDSGEVVTPSKKIREEGVTSKEITPSPHKDGYQWRKYGQKKIQNCKFSRYYYKCNRHRRCLAKKKVQQQDGISSSSRGQLMLPPVFEVTYVNEHTCHVLRANDAAAARLVSPRTTNNRRHHHNALAGIVDTARSAGGGDDLPFHLSSPDIIGGGTEENKAIVSCLATVISGGAVPSPTEWPPAPEASAAGDPAAFVPPPLPAVSMDHGGVADDGEMMMVMVDDTGFPWVPSPSSFCPIEEAGHDQQLVTMSSYGGDVHMGVAGFPDTTVWAQHTCGAWRRA
ncbi:unnamed protein product [Urochloa decumbens]|uniref:WRKY domain-containing protein n=1 Tax=Urochloa decumbens TaxID=240449 RepID=A0ABC9A741_9POAL